MSTPRQTPIPPELLKAIQEKSAEEQDRIRRVWHLLGHLNPEQLDDTDLNIPDTEQALAALEEAILEEATLAEANAAPQKPFARDRSPRPGVRIIENNPMPAKKSWLTVAATTSILLFVAMIWYWRAPVVIKAPPGTQITAVLPDQSTITLNSGSEIKYARRFESWPLIAANKRRVYLQGEAYFEVTEMTRPFIVESYNAHIRVLGTSFNVWSRPHDANPETRVTLSTGHVLVTPHGQDQQKTTLNEAGQTVHVYATVSGDVQSVKDTVPVDRASAWRSKGFSAIKMSTASIVSEIERRYDISIELDEGIDREHALTFFIQENPTPEELLENMCLSISCQYRKTSNGFRILSSSAN